MAAPAEQTPRELKPIEWGTNLAQVDVHYLGVYNSYLEVGAVRPDGSIAMFGELNSGGYDGSRQGFSVTDEAHVAAPGRAFISQAVQAIMDLEKLTEPEDSHFTELKPPVGEWEPETIASQGIKSTLSDLSLSRSVGRRFDALREAGWVNVLNTILEKDNRIAVGLQKEASSRWSIIKLVGFEEYKYASPGTTEPQTGLRAVVRDRNGTVGLRPENARIERAFIKRD